jgi:predicted transposase YbfD/YdcC
VRASGGDFVITLKGNRAPQLEHVKAAFATAHDKTLSKFSTTNSGHGRQEARIVYALPASGWHWTEWRDIRSFVMVERIRQTAKTTSTETHFYLSSLKPDAKLVAEAIRAHWGIENGLHWMLDVVFREDDQRIRDQRGAENFAVLNRLALMLLRNEKTKKIGAPTKRKRAGWDNSYLARVLTCGLAEAS